MQKVSFLLGSKIQTLRVELRSWSLLRARSRLRKSNQSFDLFFGPFVGRSCFYLWLGLVGLTVGQAIGRAKLLDRKVAVDIFKWSLWKELISFLDAEWLMMIPKYFFPWNSPFMLSNHKGLVASLTSTHWHRRDCPKSPSSCTLHYCCRPQILNSLPFCPPALSCWCPASAVICGRYCEFFISLVVWACRLACLLDVSLGTV